MQALPFPGGEAELMGRGNNGLLRDFPQGDDDSLNDSGEGAALARGPVVVAWTMLRTMARPRRRRSKLASPEAIGGVIARAERSQRHEGSATRPSVSASDWEAAVGMRIADRAKPLELEAGVLTVRVATSVWASELSLLAGPILERLRDRGIQVRGLRCRVGEVPPPLRPKALRATFAVPPPLPLPAALEGILASVDDEDLRSTIAAAARANLAWQAYVDGKAETGAGVTPARSRAARVPQSAGTETGRPDRTTAKAPAGSRRTP